MIITDIMKLQKHKTRKKGTEDYFKWELVMPKDVIKNLDWDETIELEASAGNGELDIEKKFGSKEDASKNKLRIQLSRRIDDSIDKEFRENMSEICGDRKGSQKMAIEFAFSMFNNLVKNMSSKEKLEFRKMIFDMAGKETTATEFNEILQKISKKSEVE